MTTETILTDEIISELAAKHLWAHAQFIGAGEVYYEGEIEFARAIEQAVLQSPEIQALHKDAKRYRYLKKGNQWIVAATQTGFHIDGGELDDLIDNELEKQK